MLRAALNFQPSSAPARLSPGPRGAAQRRRPRARPPIWALVGSRRLELDSGTNANSCRAKRRCHPR